MLGIFLFPSFIFSFVINKIVKQLQPDPVSPAALRKAALFLAVGAGVARSLSVVGNERSRDPACWRSAGVGGAGCLLHYESSALPMTAQLRHRQGVGLRRVMS